MSANKAMPTTRGRDSYRPKPIYRPKPHKIERTPSPPFGPLVQKLTDREVVLSADKVEGKDSSTAKITGCEYVASFNWLDRENPAILIPGSPPAWTPLNEPVRLKEDNGHYFRDPNAARFPTFPLEPAVRVLLAGNDTLETHKIDLFACSSTVGSLLRFVRQVDKPFRFFVQVIGNTAFFLRHENSPTAIIENVRGYGHTFPESYTTWDSDVMGSVSHQRLLRYSFAGLNCILRYECDGYIQSRVPEVTVAPTSDIIQKREDYKRNDGTGDDIALSFSSLRMKTSVKGVEENNLIQVKPGGQYIAQESVFDLKTRAAWKDRDKVFTDELPRFWVAQIPNFILALHENGVFKDIKVDPIKDKVQKWEQDNEKPLKALGWLLRKIIEVVKARPDGKLEVRCKNLQALELREQANTDHNILPPELRKRWVESLVVGGTKSNDPRLSDTNDSLGGRGRLIPNRSLGKFRSEGESGDESEKDYTACSAEDCGYCGHCSY